LDPLQHPALHELAQVAAYGLRRDLQVVGERGDLDPAVVAGVGQNLSLALVSLHRSRPSFSALGPSVTRVTSLSLPQGSLVAEPTWASTHARMMPGSTSGMPGSERKKQLIRTSASSKGA